MCSSPNIAINHPSPSSDRNWRKLPIAPIDRGFGRAAASICASVRAILLHMNDEATEQNQMALCRQHGRDFVPCPPDSKPGIALQTLDSVPINGLQHRPAAGTNGWYIWAGEFSSENDFFGPLHTSHLPQRLPQVVKFLGIPPEAAFS